MHHHKQQELRQNNRWVLGAWAQLFCSLPLSSASFRLTSCICQQTSMSTDSPSAGGVTCSGQRDEGKLGTFSVRFPSCGLADVRLGPEDSEGEAGGRAVWRWLSQVMGLPRWC